jgi:predicted translin family RNA/ssDNA-binding protein
MAERDSWLSELVEDFIDTQDHFADSDLPPEEREEAQRDRRFVDVVVKDIINSRQSLTENSLRGIERLVEAEPELIKHFLNDHFTREVVHAVPGYVERTMQLSRLEAQQTASKVTNAFLKEAVRTYLLGLPQACVALCRAALEQALKERMGFQLAKTYVEMPQLLDEAEGAGVLDPTLRRMAAHIAKEAGDVLHEKPTNLKTAYEVLVELRGVLMHVYQN